MDLKPDPQTDPIHVSSRGIDAKTICAFEVSTSNGPTLQQRINVFSVTALVIVFINLYPLRRIDLLLQATRQFLPGQEHTGIELIHTLPSLTQTLPEPYLNITKTLPTQEKMCLHNTRTTK